MTEWIGKHVVVVGCGIGITGLDDIGRASAAHFASLGAHVSLIEAVEQQALDTVAEIAAAGGSASAHTNDPREAEGILALAERILAERPVVDALVTHLFAADMSGIDGLSVADWEQTIRVNLTGAYAATKAFLPGLRRAERGSIVHTTSIDGWLGNVNVPSFSASKGGVTVLIHVLAGELAAEGIRVNGIARATSTAMPLKPEVYAELNRATPLGRAAEPPEYAKTIEFLTSDASSYVTGAILAVDGGRTALTPGCTPSYLGFGNGAVPSASGYRL